MNNLYGNNFNNSSTDSKEIFNPKIDFNDNDTDTAGNNVLYRLNLTDQTLTSTIPWKYQMSEEFKEILFNSPNEGTIDEASPFIVETKKWIERYGNNAIELLIIYMNSTYSDIYIISEILEMLGEVSNQASYELRRLFLESNLTNYSPQIRYGAAIGLANMKASESLKTLKEALTREKDSDLSKIIKKVIEYLKKNDK